MADSIVSVLECCQTTTTSAAQQDLLAALTSVHNKCGDQRRFCDEYVALLRRCLAHGDKSPAVERILDLTARFAGSLCANDKTLSATASNASGDMDSDEQQQQQDEVHPFFSQMVRVVLDSHNVSGSQLVRERSCRLLQHLLLHLGEDALLDDQLCEHIYQAMLQRLQDAAPAVRQHAVAALARLQTPSDRQCPVVAAFVFHLRCDPSADVRCAVLRHICGARHTLQPVFERARDVSAPVRRQTYCFLIKVHLKSLTIKQRRSVLRLGLNDRDASVRRTVATQLLPAWLRLLKCSVAKLLHHLYVETCADLAELVVKTACTDLSPTEMADMVGFGEVGAAGVTADQLSSEQALLWRVLLQCLREHGSAEAEAALERITPDLPAMCRLLEQVAEKVLSAAEGACVAGDNAGASSTTQTANVEADAAEAAAGRAFVLRQLLALTGALDLWDEFGRRQLVTLIQRLFSRCRQQQQQQQQALSLLEPLMRLYERAVPDVAQRVSAVVDVISELLAPIDQQPDGERASQDVPASADNAAKDGGDGDGDDDNQSSRLRVERAQLRVQINELRDQLDAAVARQDFADAQQLQQRLAQLQLQQNRLDTQLDAPATGNAAADVRQLPERQLSSTQPENDDDKCVSVRQDAATRLTCLELLWQLLQSANVSRLSDQLRQLTDELVLPCVQSEQPAVRRVAVTALSTMCLLSASLARQHLVLLVQVCQADETEIQLAAFRGVFDQLLVHGPRQLLSAAQPSADEQQEDQLTVIMAQLTQLLDVTDNEARGVGVEGLCRLLMHGRVRSPRLLERLVLLWYSPLSDDDAPVRNMLGVFLPAFASAARHNQQLLAEAMLPTLLTLIQAPLASPLVEVDIDDVARFFVQLTRECMLDSGKPTATSIATGDQHSDASVHEWLAFRLITALLDERRCRADAARRPLARALCQLQLHTMSQTSAEQLRQLLDRLTSGDTTAAAGGDKTVRRCLDKLAMTVCALCDTVNTTAVTSSPHPPPPAGQQDEEEDGEEEMVFEQQTTESPPGPHCVVEQMADGEVHLCSDVADKRNANTPPAREVKALRSARPSAANVRHSAILSAGIVAESDEEDDDVISTTTTTSSPCSSLAGDNSRAGTRKSSRQATRTGHKTAAPQANTTKSRRNARR